MSNVALLDMLANGTNPPKIMPYLGDCYDSLANLTFITLEDGTTSSKTVNEMVSIWVLCSRRHLVAVYRRKQTSSEITPHHAHHSHVQTCVLFSSTRVLYPACLLEREN